MTAQDDLSCKSDVATACGPSSHFTLLRRARLAITRIRLRLSRAEEVKMLRELQPKGISQETLPKEYKAIFTSLRMSERKCIEANNIEASSAQDWQAELALHVD